MFKQIKTVGLSTMIFMGLGILSACIDRSEAGGGVSQAAFDALAARVVTLEAATSAQTQANTALLGKVDALLARVVTLETANSAQAQTNTALQGKVDALEAAIAKLAKSSNIVQTGVATRSKSQQTSSALKQLLEGEVLTYVSYLPANQPIYQATSLQIRSSTGYLFAIPAPDGGYPLPVTAYYQSSDCSGTPFVSWTDISDYGRKQGAVFTYVNDQSADNVGYIPPNAPRVAGTFGSRAENRNCFAGSFDFPVDVLTEVLPNDTAITGVNNTRYDGPVLMQ